VHPEMRALKYIAVRKRGGSKEKILQKDLAIHQPVAGPLPHIHGVYIKNYEGCTPRQRVYTCRRTVGHR